MYLRLTAVADAATEDDFHRAVADLHSCREWQLSADLHSWFENTWLSEKEVHNIFRTFSVIILLFTFVFYNEFVNVSASVLFSEKTTVFVTEPVFHAQLLSVKYC